VHGIVIALAILQDVQSVSTKLHQYSSITLIIAANFHLAASFVYPEPTVYDLLHPAAPQPQNVQATRRRCQNSVRVLSYLGNAAHIAGFYLICYALKSISWSAAIVAISTLSFALVFGAYTILGATAHGTYTGVLEDFVVYCAQVCWGVLVYVFDQIFRR
jgi:hypothetical protein